MRINIDVEDGQRGKSLKCAVVGVAMGMGYCPNVFGWRDYEGCGGDPALCIGCWDRAQREADSGAAYE